MKVSKLRDMTEEELLAEVAGLKEAVFKLRVQKAIGQLEKPHKLGDNRRDLARAYTVLGEKRAAKESK